MAPSPIILEALREAYRTGNLLVFAGAGIPAAAGLPNWPLLAKGLRDRAMSENCAPDVLSEIDDLLMRRQFIDALSAVKHALGAHEFDLAIERAVDDSRIPVPDVAKAIAELKPKLRAVVTTNLDRFLERAFEGNWQDLAIPTGNLAQRYQYILKLHGTRTDRSTWIFVRDQYDQATFGWPRYRGTFETLFRAYSILFVGYGLSDDDFDMTLAATRALAGPNPPTHFALLQTPIPPFRRTKLEGAGLRLIEYDKHEDVPGIIRSIP